MIISKINVIKYICRWKEYKELRDWAQNTDMIYPHGVNGGKMIDWFYFPDLSEETHFFIAEFLYNCGKTDYTNSF